MESNQQPAINAQQIEGILQFLREAEQLKDVMRSAYTSQGRQESTAEHTWRLCLSVLALGPWLANLDLHKLLKICVVHDLGEALHGDTPAPMQDSSLDKREREQRDMQTITQSLPEAVREEILQLWEDYEYGRSAEARLAKGLDKIETLIQHTQGDNPTSIDYAYNLDYGKQYTDLDPLLALLRSRVDVDTRARMSDQVS